MNHSTRIWLSTTMFLQYFVWGCWYVTLATYLSKVLKVDAVQIGSAYANLSIAAIISPFIVGLIADKYLSPQKIYSLLHLLGAVILIILPFISNFTYFWWAILFYTITYLPTIPLANSISFRQMNDITKEFPSVRVFGTIGWIASGLLIGYLGIEESAVTFKIGAASALLLACMGLLHKEEPFVKSSSSVSKILGSDAFVLFRQRSFLLFFIASILICIPLAFYYSFTNLFLNDIGLKNAASVMTLGQFSEFAFLFMLPFLLKKFGIKNILLFGMLAWACRYVLFSFGNTGSSSWMLYAGIILHGICYDFFFVTGQIYTDKKAGPTIKNSAQGLITLATYGIGMLLGSYVSGFVTQGMAVVNNNATIYNWKIIWIFPAGIALVVFVLFGLLFKENVPVSESTEHVEAPAGLREMY